MLGAAVLAAALALGQSPATSVAAQGASPPTKVTTVRDPRIEESSGLVVSPSHPGLVWTVNDSGSAAVVYGVSTRDGRTRAVLTMAGPDGETLDARDMEAMAAGRDRSGRAYLWVGDIGDNRAVRDSVVLRLLREPGVVTTSRVRTVSLRVRYPDGPVDAETLLWLPDGRLLVVTKSLLAARVYEVPAEAVRRALAGRDVATPAVAQQVASVPETLATDGAALPDGRVVIRGYGSGTLYGRLADGLPAVESIVLPDQPQGETLAVERGGRSVLVGSEGVRQPLWRVGIPAAPTAPTETPSQPPATAPATTSATPADGSSGPPWPEIAAVAFAALAAGGLAVVTAAVARGLRRRRGR